MLVEVDDILDGAVLTIEQRIPIHAEDYEGHDMGDEEQEEDVK